ncbi:MAG: hypothetical protein ACR2HR_07185 [Euzebya sp.]
MIAVRIAFTALPPGTTIAGVTVRTPAEVVAVAEDVSDRLSNLPVQITTPAGSTTVRASQLGASLVTNGLRQSAQDATGGDAWIERFTGGGTVELPIDVTDVRIKVLVGAVIGPEGIINGRAKTRRRRSG